MFCPDCCKEISNNVKFCGSCGYKVTNTETVVESKPIVENISKSEDDGIEYDGGRYVGEYNSENLPHGVGTLKKTGPDGTVVEIYEGKWENGLHQGKGTWTLNDSDGSLIDHYEGSWNRGVYDGYNGTRVWKTPDGESKFKGEFRKGIEYTGIVTNPDGSTKKLYEGRTPENWFERLPNNVQIPISIVFVLGIGYIVIRIIF